MKHTSGMRARRTGRVLVAVAAVAVLGADRTLAAPPTGAITFESARFSIEAGNGGAETAAAAGGLTCVWRETGLHSFQLIAYACDAVVVGAVEGCVYKNKLVPGSATQLSVFRNPQVLLGGPVGFVSNNAGKINATTTTAVPESEGAGGHLCTEPAEGQVIAVRWCSVSLTDTVNNVVGATATELFAEIYSGGGAAVPACTELLVSP